MPFVGHSTCRRTRKGKQWADGAPWDGSSTRTVARQLSEISAVSVRGPHGLSLLGWSRPYSTGDLRVILGPLTWSDMLCVYVLAVSTGFRRTGDCTACGVPFVCVVCYDYVVKILSSSCQLKWLCLGAAMFKCSPTNGGGWVADDTAEPPRERVVDAFLPRPAPALLVVNFVTLVLLSAE